MINSLQLLPNNPANDKTNGLVGELTKQILCKVSTFVVYDGFSGPICHMR